MRRMTGKDIPFDKTLGPILIKVALRVFVAAWLIDIVYDYFAPADFKHFSYWMAVQSLVLFYLLLEAVTGGSDD